MKRAIKRLLNSVGLVTRGQVGDVVAQRLAEVPAPLAPTDAQVEEAHLRECLAGAAHLHGCVKGWPAARALADERVPVLLGPWVSEVGFEVLYWVPLLRAMLPHLGVSPDRVTAFSRGGVRSWYAGLAGDYVDVFDLLTPEEFHAGNVARIAELGHAKQTRLAGFEKRLVAEAARGLGLTDFVLLHPALMYNFFLPAWTRSVPHRRLEDWTRFERLTAPAAPVPFARYVAVKAYFSDCFPDTPENRAFLRSLLAHLGRRHNVVLLNTAMRLDDHGEDAGLDLPNVFDAGPLMTPRDNLDVQTRIVAHADAFYGTYGGFSYLAPLLGRPTLALYSHRNFCQVHLHVSGKALNTVTEPLFTPISTQALGAILPALARADRKAA